MKTLIPDDEIKQLINIIGGENNIKELNLNYGVYILYLMIFKELILKVLRLYHLFSILSWVIVKLKLVAKIMNKIIICLIIL